MLLSVTEDVQSRLRGGKSRKLQGSHKLLQELVLLPKL